MTVLPTVTSQDLVRGEVDVAAAPTRPSRAEVEKRSGFHCLCWRYHLLKHGRFRSRQRRRLRSPHLLPRPPRWSGTSANPQSWTQRPLQVKALPFTCGSTAFRRQDRAFLLRRGRPWHARPEWRGTGERSGAGRRRGKGRRGRRRRWWRRRRRRWWGATSCRCSSRRSHSGSRSRSRSRSCGSCQQRWRRRRRQPAGCAAVSQVGGHTDHNQH